MRQSALSNSVLRSLDSLVDIVSNNLGILIILAAFMAMLGLFNEAVQEDPARPPDAPPPPEKLLVPWSHPTHKNPVLFAIRGNRLLHLNMPTFFRALAKIPPQNRPRPVTVRQKGVTVRFFPVTNQVYCLEFKPEARAGETWHEAALAASVWSKVRAHYQAEKFYYFFWVTGDSFELFREVRAQLWKKNIEVGWKPSGKKEAMEICSGFEGSTGFQPQ